MCSVSRWYVLSLSAQCGPATLRRALCLTTGRSCMIHFCGICASIGSRFDPPQACTATVGLYLSIILTVGAALAAVIIAVYCCCCRNSIDSQLAAENSSLLPRMKLPGYAKAPVGAAEKAGAPGEKARVTSLLVEGEQQRRPPMYMGL